MALNRDNDGIFGGNGAGFIILILFFLTMGGGYGWGNGNASMQGALTRAEMYDGLNAQNTFSEFRQVQSDMNCGFDRTNQNLCNGFANQSIQLTNGFNGVQSAIADTRYAMQNCCCEIKNTIHSEGEATRALIQANTIQELRDKIQDKDRELLATGLVTAQTIQTNNLENFIRNILATPATTPTA